jgi:hypothetical protein
MTLQWDTTPHSDTAVFMVGGLIPIQLRAQDHGWSIRGVDGRRKTGAASSRDSAKVECIRGVEQLLRSGLLDLKNAP